MCLLCLFVAESPAPRSHSSLKNVSGAALPLSWHVQESPLNHTGMKAHDSHGTRWVAVQLSLFAAQFASVLLSREQWSAVPSRTAGAILLVASSALGLSGLRALGRNLTPLPEPKVRGKLVTSGIYAYIRHPLYACVIAIGFGWALLWRSWPALLLAFVQAAFLRAKAMHEETLLRERFPDYEAYAGRVPRFMPHLLRTAKNSKLII